MYKVEKITFLMFSMLMCSVSISSQQILNSNFTENEYESVERIFINNTDHIDKLIEFVQIKTFPQMASQESFLDIGPGPGIVTERIAKHFLHTSVVEPNPVFATLYESNGYAYYGVNFQEAKLSKSFDLVLCSHVLYHLERNEWRPFIQKIYDTMTKKGQGIIVLVAPRGTWHDLRTLINLDYSNSGIVEQILKELGVKYELTPVTSVFKVSECDDFRQLVYLFTIDDCYTSEQFKHLTSDEKTAIYDKLDKFIEDCKTSDGSYELICEDDYLTIQKN